MLHLSLEHGVSDAGRAAKWSVSEKLGRLLGSTRAPITSAHFWVDVFYSSAAATAAAAAASRDANSVWKIFCRWKNVFL